MVLVVGGTPLADVGGFSSILSSPAHLPTLAHAYQLEALANVFNSSRLGWEPALEPWAARGRALLVPPAGGWGSGVGGGTCTASLEAPVVLDLTVTEALVDALADAGDLAEAVGQLVAGRRTLAAALAQQGAPSGDEGACVAER